MSGERNDLLVERRLDLGLTQEELAQLVNAQVEIITGSPGNANGDYIGKLEARRIGRPHAHTRQALRVVLRVESDMELGFGLSGATVDRSPQGGDDVERRRFLASLTGAVAGLGLVDPLALFDSVAPTGEPNQRVGPGHVSQVRALARFYAEQDHLFGGVAYAQSTMAQLGQSAQLRHHSMTDEIRKQLLDALAELADVVGGIAFDAGQHSSAGRAFRFASGCAVESGNWALRAKALSGLANQAVHQRRYDDALTEAETALVRLDLMPPVVQAMVLTRHARALGVQGPRREEDCIAAIRRAEETFAVDTGDEPEWARYYDRARLHRDCARARLGLALRGGEYTEVYEQLVSAVSAFPAGHSRGRTLAMVNLAALTMARVSPEEAVRTADEVLKSIDTVRSARVLKALEQLRDVSLPHCGIPEVATLTRELNKILPMAS
ncbi:transcriptional regulator with XRE-family HTH domain [Crossiella equi]|uniref:Transcriptional regulator with XRE-family HTH domain n=1 Tax=Crossiella equi TaxID=130796 RepID=A0ABS5AM15_9PSEU|nr:hypothetical protein [Crossiella equi]MBP2477599.1 transcriptional regulator with XRE-family HTH domain [Crossiella equi]